MKTWNNLGEPATVMTNADQPRMTRKGLARWGTIWKKPERFGKVRKGMGIYGKSGKMWNNQERPGTIQNGTERLRKVW